MFRPEDFPEEISQCITPDGGIDMSINVLEAKPCMRLIHNTVGPCGQSILD